jgi:hypothetical protein
VDPFQLDRFMIRRAVFVLFGAKFHVYKWDSEEVCFFAEQKAFKLKEDFIVFGDEEKKTPLLRIQARQILDVSATYDISDARTGEKVGAVRRKGLKSLLKDEWLILDTNDQPVAMCAEDSMALALIRRLLTNLVPQTYHVRDGAEGQGDELAQFRQFFNPFIFKMELDYSMDKARALDRRLGIGLAVVLMAIEGRQQG